MQERQFPPFESDNLTLPERAAAQPARARRLFWLTASLGAGVLALFSIGCPEPGDLQNAEVYPSPTPATGGQPTNGGGPSGGSGGGATTGSCETACLATILNTPSTGCKSCHGSTVRLSGTLDFETPGYTARLKDQAAEHAGVAAGADCPTGDKLIDSAKPTESWLLKKVTNMQGACGTVMPLSGPLSADEQACFTTYVNCVAGGT